MRIPGEDSETIWECPRCHHKNFYHADIREKLPCPNCGWDLPDKDPNRVPEEVKIRLE